jgi:hypothetical protein
VTFRSRNLEALERGMHVALPTDDQGYMGRECPQASCEGYFKVKPGTGLTGPDLQCVCPYCGHHGAPDQFFTKEQLEYVKSVALRAVTDALHMDLKQLEFNHKPRGAFGIGLSMKVERGAPVPIRHYREKALETHVTCAACTLAYAVYGVFAYCPDCGVHNSVQILKNNLALAKRQVVLAQSLDDAELRRHLIEDALENCVSTFDGFARERCKAFASKATDSAKAENISFQNLPRAGDRARQLWGIDLRQLVGAEKWARAHRLFLRRHLLAHCAGVIDQKYIDESADNSVIVGRRIAILPSDVEELSGLVLEIGESFAKALEATTSKSAGV